LNARWNRLPAVFLDRLQKWVNPRKSNDPRLRYFAGLSVEDAADVVGISRSTAYEHWSYARVRLKTLLHGE